MGTDLKTCSSQSSCFITKGFITSFIRLADFDTRRFVLMSARGQYVIVYIWRYSAMSYWDVICFLLLSCGGCMLHYIISCLV